jgi:CubicO group peptidase (beta-lactamase class C family)
MYDKPTRRDLLKTTATLAATSAFALNYAALTRAKEPTDAVAGTLPQIDAVLRAAVSAKDVPGVVAMAATETGVVYEGVFGSRRIHEGPAMTRDTIFRVASMVKLITSVAALRLVEQGKLSLEAPAPNIDPLIGAPQVLDGFDAAGKPLLRPAKRPISLHDLLTHTAGFVYRLWDREALKYYEAIDKLPAAERRKLPRAPLMFDPGERWRYGGNIDWVGRIVQAVSGEPLDAHFRKHIFEPLGMNDTGFVISPAQWAREASGHRRQRDGSLRAQPMEHRPKWPPAPQSFSGGGGIYSSAPDYLTLIRMLMHGGALNGARILHPDTVALMGQNQIGQIDVGVLRTTVPAVSNDVDFFPGNQLKWGFGHMITTQPVPEGRSAGSLTWAGIYNTHYWIDPKERIAAVFMTQVLPFADKRVLGVYRRFERGIYAAVRAGHVKAG